MKPIVYWARDVKRYGINHPTNRNVAAWFFQTTSRLVGWFNILSHITGSTLDLQCRFENQWSAGLFETRTPNSIVHCRPSMDSRTVGLTSFPPQQSTFPCTCILSSLLRRKTEQQQQCASRSSCIQIVAEVCHKLQQYEFMSLVFVVCIM